VSYVDTDKHVLRTFTLSIIVISNNFCGIPHYLGLLGQPIKHLPLGISRKYKAIYDRNRAKAKNWAILSTRFQDVYLPTSKNG